MLGNKFLFLKKKQPKATSFHLFLKATHDLFLLSEENHDQMLGNKLITIKGQVIPTTKRERERERWHAHGEIQIFLPFNRNDLLRIQN
jgi:hypothetical protein